MTQSLIEHLEQLTGPDREVDAVIAVETFSEPKVHDDLIYAYLPRKADFCQAGTFWRKSRSGASLQTAPHYTSSIDAALALLLDGWEYSISTLHGIAEAELPLNDTRIEAVIVRRTDGNIKLAIIEAALRARAALEDKERG